MVNHFLGVTIFVWFFGLALAMCSVILCMPHPYYIFIKFFDMGISYSFCRNYVHDKGTHWEEHCFTLAHFCAFCFTTTILPICVFLYLVDDTHIMNLTSNVILTFFTIAKNVINIRFFCAANEMCNLVSLKVGALYIASSWLSYS
jgi:hypothetical protein